MADTLSRNPKFDALRNALYHTGRMNFFDKTNKSINFLVIISSAAVVSKLLSGSFILEFSVVVLSTIQLVFDFGSSASKHEFLQKKYYDLLSDMELQEENENNKRMWSAKLITICGEETIIMRAADAVAFNAACDALFEDSGSRRLEISFPQFALRHIWPFHNTNFSCPGSQPSD